METGLTIKQNNWSKIEAQFIDFWKAETRGSLPR